MMPLISKHEDESRIEMGKRLHLTDVQIKGKSEAIRPARFIPAAVQGAMTSSSCPRSTPGLIAFEGKLVELEMIVCLWPDGLEDCRV